MKLVVFSHKPVWPCKDSLTGYATDGGFAFHMKAISEIFEQTLLVLPLHQAPNQNGEIPINGHNITIKTVNDIKGRMLSRKIRYPFWLLKNIFLFIGEIRKADAVHVPIPSDMGTIPMVLAHIMGKPLFVRHCGNWFIQKTKTEKFWHWFMERYAGGRNLFLATGGAKEAPSSKNPNIKWIFSTSMQNHEIEKLKGKSHAIDKKEPRIVIACRLEENKGAGRVLDAVSLLVNDYPNIIFDVAGEGSFLPDLKHRAKEYGIEKNVIFHHKINHDQVIELMQKADIFCFPTRASEGFPKVALEAMACGLPVVANPVSVLPQLLENGGGILLANDDKQTIADALKSIIENSELFKEMQLKAQQTVENFSLENWGLTIKTYLKESWKDIKI
ncbi:MAG: glycosyltransferase [Bacteroidetes bacterium]|nr:glycosyltransferase [Bacteroidota bacterium]